MSAQVTCAECGKLNAASARFCRGCGAKPSAAGAAGGGEGTACFACGKVNPAGYKACKDCGAPPPKPKKAETEPKTSPRKKEEPEKAPASPRKKAEEEAPAAKTKKEPKEEEEEEPKSKPVRKASPAAAEEKKTAPAKQKACQNCGFKNDAEYDKCSKCKEPNPAKAAEAAAAAAKKPEKKASVPPAKPKEENPKEDLLKGVEFKTKVKGVTETSNIKLGDLAAGMRVWVTVSGDDGWAPAEVVSVKKDITVTHEEDGSQHDYPPSKVFIRNPPNLDNVSDLTQLSYMHEPGLLYILSERYANSQIYTFTGTTLIAVNPYARLPLYGKEILDSYVGQPIGRMPPHVFAVAEDAFRSMMDFFEPQSVLVSGESGAGKTETTKVLLQYLAAMGALGDAAGGDEGAAVVSSGKGKKGGAGGGGAKTASGGSVEQQVLQSNPVLEAFGNAKTLRNDNSSRFGKFIRIQFNARGHIEGAQVQTYLLEKPRLTAQIPGERNFHIFYQLCKGASTVEKKQLALKDASEYHYLNQGNCFDVPNLDDEKEFEILRDALKIFGIGAEEQKALWRYLSGILEVGNITFKQEDDGREDAVLDNGKPLAYAAKLLGLKQEDMKKSLLRRQVTMGKNLVTIRLKVGEAETARDAFAMLLYGRLFDHLVKLINKGLSGATGIDEESKRFIGVLDIYGFEFFEKNSFEQFCINWANEKLQQQFNQHIFKLEQAEYVREKIDWAYIEFADNQPILSLIEDKAPLGIVPILDEQCRFPKSDHITFAEKLFADFGKHPYFEKPKFSKTAFTIDHYAGKVTYDTLLFLDKNRDFLIPEQFIILGDSEEEFVKSMFAQSAAEYKESGGSMKFASVGSAFKSSLADLMSVINRTQTHYVRCIKPNDKKKPGVFQKAMSLHQLRCGGVLETMRIAAAGFPTRWPFQKFCERYRILAPNLYDEFNGKWKECATALIKKIGLEANQYQMGLTKVFLRAGLVALFEELLKRKLDEAAIFVQKHVRGFVKRRQFLRIKRNAVVMQCRVRLMLAKQLLAVLRERLCAITMQAHVRAFLAARRFRRLRKMAVRVQRRVRNRRMMVALRKLLQSSRLDKQQEQKRTKLVVRCQAVIRMKLQRRKFLVKRAEARDVVGKFQKVMDEKSQLETKVEELTWRLAAQNQTKNKLQDEKAELEEKLKKEGEEAEGLRKEVRSQKKLIEELQKKGTESAAKVVEVTAKRDDLAAQLEAAEKRSEAKDAEVAELKKEALQAKTNKVDEEKIASQAVRIAELEAEVKRIARMLEEEKLRSKEITESVMSLKAQEVDLLQSKIQGAYGFVPTEPYFGLQEETNSAAVLATRQQMETLVRMTAKKTKDEGVFALIDFLLLRVHEGFSNGDTPTLGFCLVHVLNHWDCFRKERVDVMDHVIQGLDVEIPTIATSNFSLSYYLNSVLYLLHSTDQQLLLASVEDPWYTDRIVMDNEIELPELSSKQALPGTVQFLSKARHLAARLYMELVFNIEETLDPLLRPCVSSLVAGNIKAARGSFQSVIKELQTTVSLATTCFWPQGVLAGLLKQILYYLNAFLMNSVLAQKVLCNRDSAAAMSEWLADLTKWLESAYPQLAASSDCLTQLNRLSQVLELLVADKTQLGKLSEAAARKIAPDLLAPQVKQVLTNYVPAKGEEAVPARVVRALTKGRDDGDLLIDKTVLFPLSVKELHEVAFIELVTLPFPTSVGKSLAEEMASKDVIDDEYVVVNFDLDAFEIGDEMDDIELEEDTAQWEEENDMQDLDEETRKRLMLAYDDMGGSKTNTLKLKSPPGRGSVAQMDFSETAQSSGALGSTQDLIREKLQARMEAKRREKEEEERKKKEAEQAAAAAAADGESLPFAWQVGDSCEAVFIDDGQWYAAEIVEGPNKKGNFKVLFTEYDNTQWTEPELLRLSPEMLELLAPGSGELDEGLPVESTIFGDDVSLLQASDDPFKEL